MNKHTPGPWGVSFNGKGTWNIEEIGGDSRHIASAERQQDGHLIVAAPELLDLLRAAIARIELANAEGNNILSAWLPDARAAIRAAEGEGKS